MAAPSWRPRATLIGCLAIGSIAAARGDLLASARSAITQQTLSVFTVSEATAGDLNGDGDAVDAVVHVTDAKSGAALNLRLAASTVCRTTFEPPFVNCQPVEPMVDRLVAAILVSEAAQGGRDLNGDADALDDVLYVYEGKSGELTATALAVPHGVGRDVSSYRFPIAPAVTDKRIVLLVSEAESGGVDLNGDTDAADAVFYVVDLKTRAMVNLALAAATIPGPFGSRNPIAPEVSGQKVTVTAGELEQGTDLNGDGDTDDQVAYVIHQDELKAVTSATKALSTALPQRPGPASRIPR